ncbi:hypothetical protein EV421DRAFT_2024342 [Armillaria borealis]|uniref:Heterokaryon incompatibility domain-containing protein n=1 Tax=Armillaria borealis TaxID=47425 RepID=A0AA39IYA5_9AGAR|nr:hypothetical protein EV421DRAFT_2024342 [Armillaria borealis]
MTSALFISKTSYRLAEAWDHQMRQDVLVNDKIIGPLVPPRRVWDLFSNRVVPWWVTRLVNHSHPWAISHAWMKEEDRVNVRTPINGCEWPVPMPRDANLDLIRIEMLNEGAEYLWLDVLCLRQVGGCEENLLAEEWKLDVPTIGCVYSMASDQLVCYLSGLGRPFSLKEDDLESDRCWFRRAWTLQETQRHMIIGGDTGDDIFTEKEMRTRVENRLSLLEQGVGGAGPGTPVFSALSEMQKRVSTNNVDRVAGLSYLLQTEEIPAYYAAQSEEEAWNVLVDEMAPPERAHMFFLYPQPGNGSKCWRPSWKQAMTEVLPPPHLSDLDCGWDGSVQRTKEKNADWCDGFCITTGYVRGLSQGSLEGNFRQGELVLEHKTGAKHTFMVVADHQYPIPEGLYALVGSPPFDFLQQVFNKQCWVIGKRLPRQTFKKVSVFRMPDKEEVKRLHDLNIATYARTVLA